MPELPEIEHLRRTLEPHLVGARVTGVDLRRRDMVRVAGSRQALRAVNNAHLLHGATVTSIVRHGKSLAFLADNGRVLATHMGMSGSLVVRQKDHVHDSDKHLHCIWTLLRSEPAPSLRRSVASSLQSFQLFYRDPRRFGGLWPLASLEELNERLWSRLGPDALSIDGETLRDRLARTTQPIKAALLNQSLVAGVGNIYADEALFAAGIHPLTKPTRIALDGYGALATAIRSIMLAAVNSGGSTISDYRDATGQAGSFAFQHAVYGRAELPCMRCGRPLRSIVVGQRTTVFCQLCQTRRTRTTYPRG